MREPNVAHGNGSHIELLCQVEWEGMRWEWEGCREGGALWRSSHEPWVEGVLRRTYSVFIYTLALHKRPSLTVFASAPPPAAPTNRSSSLPASPPPPAERQATDRRSTHLFHYSTLSPLTSSPSPTVPSTLPRSARLSTGPEKNNRRQDCFLGFLELWTPFYWLWSNLMPIQRTDLPRLHRQFLVHIFKDPAFEDILSRVTYFDCNPKILAEDYIS